MEGGTGPMPEIYLAIFGDTVWKNFEEIKGFLDARKLDGIIEEYDGGSIPLSHFEHFSFGYWGDKRFRDVINTYARQFAERTGMDFDGLTSGDSTWTPTAIRARVVKMNRVEQLAEELREIYEVETAIYSP